MGKTIQQQVQIAKAQNEELKQATFLVLAPDEVDLHGDIYSAEEVRKACHNYNAHSMTANLLHLVETDTFHIAESYIAPVDMVLGDRVIKSGSWLTVIQANDDEIWDEIKKGNLCGISVGCRANTEEIQEDDE